MTAATHRKARSRPARPAYLTLHGWALGTLVDHGAVLECEHHGHRLDRADPEAWNRAREEAWRNPFPGSTPEACIEAMDAIRPGLGDTCPDC
jgi:hypothetical protein